MFSNSIWTYNYVYTVVLIITKVNVIKHIRALVITNDSFDVTNQSHLSNLRITL